jgi:hypothetical protein
LSSEREALLELNEDDGLLFHSLQKQRHQSYYTPLAPIVDPLAWLAGEGRRGRSMEREGGARRHTVDAGEHPPLMAGFPFLHEREKRGDGEDRTRRMEALDREFASLAAGGHRAD